MTDSGVYGNTTCRSGALPTGRQARSARGLQTQSLGDDGGGVPGEHRRRGQPVQGSPRYAGSDGRDGCRYGDGWLAHVLRRGGKPGPYHPGRVSAEAPGVEDDRTHRNGLLYRRGGHRRAGPGPSGASGGPVCGRDQLRPDRRAGTSGHHGLVRSAGTGLADGHLGSVGAGWHRDCFQRHAPPAGTVWLAVCLVAGGWFGAGRPDRAWPRGARPARRCARGGRRHRIGRRDTLDGSRPAQPVDLASRPGVWCLWVQHAGLQHLGTHLPDRNAARQRRLGELLCQPDVSGCNPGQRGCWSGDQPHQEPVPGAFPLVPDHGGPVCLELSPGQRARRRLLYAPVGVCIQSDSSIDVHAGT